MSFLWRKQESVFMWAQRLSFKAGEACLWWLLKAGLEGQWLKLTGKESEGDFPNGKSSLALEQLAPLQAWWALSPWRFSGRGWTINSQG